MSEPKASLMDVHSSLSHLVFATRKTFEPLNLLVRIEWTELTHLCVKVECKERDKRMVVDCLKHGVLVDDYDYRFSSVSFQTDRIDPNDWTEVRAYPNLSHVTKQKGSLR